MTKKGYHLPQFDLDPFGNFYDEGGPGWIYTENEPEDISTYPLIVIIKGIKKNQEAFISTEDKWYNLPINKTIPFNLKGHQLKVFGLSNNYLGGVQIEGYKVLSDEINLDLEGIL